MKAFDLVVALNSSLLTVRIGSGHPETPSFKANHVYRIRAVDGDIVYIERDERGSGTNGWAKENFRPITGEELECLILSCKKVPCQLPGGVFEVIVSNINRELNEY